MASLTAALPKEVPPGTEVPLGETVPTGWAPKVWAPGRNEVLSPAASPKMLSPSAQALGLVKALAPANAQTLAQALAQEMAQAMAQALAQAMAMA